MTKAIDELALKVRNKTGFPIFEEDIPKFARALIAEYEKAAGSEPVAHVHTFQNGGEALSWFGESSNAASSPDWVSSKPLYARPDPRVAELEAENEQLKTVPMKYRRMEFNAQLQQENASLQEENDTLRRIHEENIEILTRQRDEYKADAERMNFLENKVPSSYTGLSFDYVKHVESGYVLEKGFRICWHHRLGKRFETIRAAIDDAIGE